jgi:protocatechuate 3,4-dioxygenase beta subunit
MRTWTALLLVSATVVMARPACADPVSGLIHAPAVNEHLDEIKLNIDDKRSIEVLSAFARTDPDGTSHITQIDDHLSYKTLYYIGEDGVPGIGGALIRTDGSARRVLAKTNETAYPGQTSAINISVCGERIILIAGGGNSGRCSDLLPLVKPDPALNQCELSCNGPYEGMPSTITSRSRIAPESEPGEPLRISGRVVDSGGRPMAGVIIYAYHTNRLGIYPPPVPARSQDSEAQGQLRGWVRTDSNGRYTFETIRPGSYPHSTNPQHVHMHIIEPGCETHFLKDTQFSDDPMQGKLTAAERTRNVRFATIETPIKTASGWEVTRNIQISENVENYKPCLK